MTSTLPWRRMILHLSHIFLTEGRTFIIISFRFMRELSILHAQPQTSVFLHCLGGHASSLLCLRSLGSNLHRGKERCNRFRGLLGVLNARASNARIEGTYLKR